MSMFLSAASSKKQHKNRDIHSFLAVVSLCLAAFWACVPVSELPLDPASPNANCPLQPTGKDFSGQDLTDHNFHADPPGSLKGANFANATLKGAIFSGQDLTGASFAGADLGPSGKGPADFTNTILEKTCFIGAVMNETDLNFATIKCADFSNTSLMQANFGPGQNIVAGDDGCRTSFKGASIEVSAITTDNWGKVDFSNTKFTIPTTFSLQGADISNAVLVGTDFSNIDMTGANLTNVDFSSANLMNTKLDNAALNGIKLVNANLRYASLTCARFYGAQADSADNPNGKACAATPDSSDPNQAADLTQAVLQHADLANATLNSAVLTSANLSGAILKNTSFINATLEQNGQLQAASVLGADLSGAFFNNAHLNHVQFNNVTLTGAVFDNTTLNGTSFTNSIMPNASFDQATLEDVNFSSTILQAASFANTTMKTTPTGGGSGVTFTCAQLGGASFKDATITAANFVAAVMPPESMCCLQPGQDSWCGTIDITQQAYGPVIYPVLNATITCPNGDVSQCSDSQWQIPNWQTNLCTADHNTQTVWAPPNCGSTPGNIVHFKDANLKACILASLPGKPAEVTVNTAAQIREVNCPGRGITDLTGLENFTSLTRLDLTANQLTQFSFSFQSLETLEISDNKLNLLDLSNLPALIRLDASNNQLQSIAGTASVYLQFLDISHNQLIDFDLPIQNALQYADLSSNNLTNVLDQSNKDLSQLTGLSYLDLSNNSLTTIGSAKSIAYSDDNQGGVLESLFLACNPNFDCSSLALDGNYPALQTSQCALFNSASNKWVLQPNPICLPSAQ